MPLPKPKKKNEEKQEFISRCIEILTKNEKDKFPSKEQRAAVCYSEWGETPKEKQAYEKRQKAKTSKKADGTKLKK